MVVPNEYEVTSTPGRFFHHDLSMCLSAFLCLIFIDMSLGCCPSGLHRCAFFLQSGL